MFQQFRISPGVYNVGNPFSLQSSTTTGDLLSLVVRNTTGFTLFLAVDSPNTPSIVIPPGRISTYKIVATAKTLLWFGQRSSLQMFDPQLAFIELYDANVEAHGWCGNGFTRLSLATYYPSPPNYHLLGFNTSSGSQQTGFGQSPTYNNVIPPGKKHHWLNIYTNLAHSVVLSTFFSDGIARNVNTPWLPDGGTLMQPGPYLVAPGIPGSLYVDGINLNLIVGNNRFDLMATAGMPPMFDGAWIALNNAAGYSILEAIEWWPEAVPMF